MSFLDCNGGLIPYSFEAWRDENKRDSKSFPFILSLFFTNKELLQGTPTKTTNRMSPTMGSSGYGSGDSSFSDRQFIVITSEKQARVVALPSQNCVYRQQIVDTDFIVKAEIISIKGKELWVRFSFFTKISSPLPQIPFVLSATHLTATY